MSKELKSGWAKVAAAATPATVTETASLAAKIQEAKASMAEAEKLAPPAVKKVLGKLRLLPRTIVVPGKKKVIGVRGGRVP